MHKRCNCGHNCIPLSKDKDFIGNLYRCSSCGFILLGNDQPVFELTDLRKYELKWSNGFNEVIHKLYQLDILRLIRIAELHNNIYYVNNFKRVIGFVDQFKNEKTNFDRKLPKINLKEIIDIQH